MNILTHAELKELAAFESPLCLTLTMPCVKAGDQQQQNPIRFKNLIQEAREKFEKLGWDERDIESFLKPVLELSDRKDFWLHQERGLAIFAADGFCEYYQVPLDLDVNVVLDTHFYLRPIIPHFQQNTDMALLLLDPERPELLLMDGFNATPHSVTPPRPFNSFSAYMGTFEQEESVQFHSQNKASRGAGAPEYHGQGTAGDDATKKEHLGEFFKQVENWVYDTMTKHPQKEIFLIAEPQNEGLYKTAARQAHPTLLPLAQKNPSSKPQSHWVDMAKNFQKKRFSSACEETISEYQRLKQQQEEKVKDDIPEIVKAAWNKRIDTLILPDDSQDYYWGRFNPETQDVLKQTKDEKVTGPGDELVNFAVIHTFLNGGKVIPVKGKAVPGYAAICTW